MGTHLASGLKKFYERTDYKFIFTNGMSLNRLALEIWERLGHQEVDASVLSRVLRGNRSFTPFQLEVFCSILKIPKSEKQYLHHCLYLDYCSRFGVKLEGVLSPTYDVYDLVEALLKKAEQLLLKGKCSELEVLTSVIEQQLNHFLAQSLEDFKKEKTYQLLGKCLYLKGRGIGSVGLPNKVIDETIPVSNLLFEIAKNKKNKDASAYANTLLANAYYVAGNYSKSLKSSYFYSKSSEYAKQAISSFSDKRNEKLFAIRTLVASSGFLKNADMFAYAKDKANKALKVTPEENYVNALHLYGTMGKTEALLGCSEAIKTRLIPRKFFNKTLKGKGIYEVSDIRNELELYLILKIKDRNYVKKMANRGLAVARKNDYIRHIRSIKRILRKLLK